MASLPNNANSYKNSFFLQFCDFREDRMESRHVCRTEMNKKCEPVTESGCLDVTELR